MFKVNNKDNLLLNLLLLTLLLFAFIVNFEHMSHFVLVFLLLILNMQLSAVMVQTRIFKGFYYFTRRIISIKSNYIMIVVKITRCHVSQSDQNIPIIENYLNKMLLVYHAFPQLYFFIIVNFLICIDFTVHLFRLEFSLFS